MECAFFKKEVPSTPIWLGNGRKITFDSVDGVTGYTLSADPNLIAQLDGCITKGIGGVSRATQEEYEGFVALKKNSTNPPKAWREELSPQQVLGGKSIAVAPAVVDSSDVRPAAAPAPRIAVPEVAPAPRAAFKPKTAKKNSRSPIANSQGKSQVNG